MKQQADSVKISILIPVYNEEGSLNLLYEKLIEVMEELAEPFEIIFVDDGSTDSSLEIMKKIEESDKRVHVLPFRANRGKADALQYGFCKTKGNIVFTMDADLQDDPKEIPRFIEKINEGYDLVSGWKEVRHDPLSKTLPSKLFNAVTSYASGIKLHDFNCGFKAYRKEVLCEVELYGDLHRYVPALAFRRGFRIGEIPVEHHPRRFGQSKYGIERLTRGLFDLLTVIMLSRHLLTPMKLMGSIGLVMLVISGGILSFLTLLQIQYGSILGHKPLSFFGVLLALLGVQFISMGVLAEIIAGFGMRKGIWKPSIKETSSTVKPNDQFLLSIVIPIHNESKSLPMLFEGVAKGISKLGQRAEVIIVDDGSTDDSVAIVQSIWNQLPAVTLIQHRRRFGKAASLQSGFDVARGSLIATMDGDLQDNPDNFEKMYTMILEGNDFVIGQRTDVPFPRNITSGLFNKVASFVSGVKVYDVNCGLKLFKADVLKNIRLYGELQRFMPILVALQGYKIKSVKVKHLERQYGKSNYGFWRIPVSFLDLFTVKITTTYRRRPLHLFGNIGFFISLVGFCINGYLAGLRFLTGSIQGHNTLLLIGTTMIVLGGQLVITGLVGELLNKTLFYIPADEK